MPLDDAALAALYPSSSDASPTNQPIQAEKIVPGSDADRANKLFGDTAAKDQAAKTQQDQRPNATKETKTPETAKNDAPPKTDQEVAQVAEAITQELQLDVASPVSAPFATFAASHNLSAEQASELADMHLQQNAHAWETIQTEWREAATAEFDNDRAGMRAAQQLVQDHADDELMSVLNDYGFGNHPAVIRFLAKVAKGNR